MARKRTAILDAARNAFLQHGYEGTSMEGIAAAAGVSIMTLYRHAEGKDDLFAAVIESACHPEDESKTAEIAEALKKPLSDLLVFVGIMFQQRVADKTTTALFRAVMAETVRFPHLGELAYRGLIGSHLAVLDEFLAHRPEFAGFDDVFRRKLAGDFIDRLIGVDSFRVLLGLAGASEEVMHSRARLATTELLEAIARRG
ncbi:TetR/AcrR family transcriptional regulator [Hyphomicrobium sp. DY-1]|uniref:TetR/AcrR family transcriptional regulator n=1 Tax=Hyphomicrobium sp. DY-1 TaxID=3075650 RepID=UPI0039C42EE9